MVVTCHASFPIGSSCAARSALPASLPASVPMSPPHPPIVCRDVHPRAGRHTRSESAVTSRHVADQHCLTAGLESELPGPRAPSRRPSDALCGQDRGFVGGCFWCVSHIAVNARLKSDIATHPGCDLCHGRAGRSIPRRCSAGPGWCTWESVFPARCDSA